MYGVPKKRRKKEVNYGESKCPQCKEKFSKRRPHQEFCCSKCRVYYFRGHADKGVKLHFRETTEKCAYCENTFTKQAAHQKFCSDDCRVKDFVKRKNGIRKRKDEEYILRNREGLRRKSENIQNAKREDV